MSDPFAPTDAGLRDPLVGDVLPDVDVHVYLVAALLLTVGVPLIGLGLLMIPTGLMLGLTDPEFEAFGPLGGLLIGVIEFLFLGFFGAIYAAGGAGLLMRHKWGWVGALVALGMLMGGCCMPFGIYGFWALLREPVRKAYGF